MPNIIRRLQTNAQNCRYGTHLILTDDDTPGRLYLGLQLQVFLCLQAKVLPLGCNLSLQLSCKLLSGQAYGLQCTGTGTSLGGSYKHFSLIRIRYK
jgi:hypothetical protein